MRLALSDGDDEENGLEIDMDDADTQELEAIAYRVTQVIWDRCEALASKMAHSGVNHPVIFLCDVADPFGLAIATKVSPSVNVKQALSWTMCNERPGVIEGVDMDHIKDSEPTLCDAIRNRMTGLLGYFPIIVAAKGGFNVFPCPYKLKEKSKFKLFPLADE